MLVIAVYARTKMAASGNRRDLFCALIECDQNREG